MTHPFVPSVEELGQTLSRLHEVKDRSYKDAWRRRGELIGIFCNIARKYDRLQVAQQEADPDGTEPRADTAADLCVYAAKYLTWLIEHDPTAASAIPAATPTGWSAVHGHPALALAITQLAADTATPPADLDAAFAATSEPFRKLEQLLVEQRDTTSTVKAELAWQLAAGALSYLWRLALDEPTTWARFSDEVARLA